MKLNFNFNIDYGFYRPRHRAASERYHNMCIFFVIRTRKDFELRRWKATNQLH